MGFPRRKLDPVPVHFVAGTDRLADGEIASQMKVAMTGAEQRDRVAKEARDDGK